MRDDVMDGIMGLADRVREIAYAIHVFHGNGHLERIYENALVHRLRKAGLYVEQQAAVAVYDEDGALLGTCVTDLIVERVLLVELKAVARLLPEHVSQILGYLKASRIRHGILVNFGGSQFEIRKFAFSLP
ncbi:MAG TPA: GxxExxY protein [Povalibacter sp.]